MRPNSLQVCAKEVMRRCKAPTLCAVRTVPSANSISLINTFRSLVFARRCERWKRFPSFLCEGTHNVLKGSREKKMLKSV